MLKPFIAIAIMLISNFNNAQAVVAPEDPRQSIVYWKPHIVDQQNPMAVKVQEIFSELLRSWTDTRIAPGVHVVNSTAGPWAASLSDGNILLSLDAVKTCLSFGETRSHHLLAFVLAHEMAHQRADDLWHQKFFRLIGTQTPETQKRLLRGIDTQWLNDVEQKEAQADHDALVMMASVGFDPYQVIEKQDFFTTWVEQLWRSSCGESQAGNAAQAACEQAKTRSLRAKTQLQTVATQSTVYDLAIQAFVAGNDEEARHLFRAYGRELPSRAVYSGIGLSYLSQALKLQRLDDFVDADRNLAFFYPILLDASPQATPIDAVQTVRKRGVNSFELEQQKNKIHALLTKAIENFEKAIKLEPNNRRSYLSLAITYLVDDNTFMTRGILQGQFRPRFGDDNALDLILAMTSAIEGDHKKAKHQLYQLIDKISLQTNIISSSLPSHLLQYTANYNLAVLHRADADQQKEKTLWKNLAAKAKQQGDSLLFRMALTQLTHPTDTSPGLQQYPQIASFRPGNTFEPPTSGEILPSEFWIDGEKQLIYRLPALGIRVVVGVDKKIASVWQISNTNANIGRLSIGDPAGRAHNVLGIPSRELFFQRGVYLAYDQYGLGVHVVNNQIAGWFLYDKI